MRRSLNNRPLRSVLANRKMFQGGGIVANGGGPRPMANMQPNGILASSPNLIDSVVSDAINPQGGNTLSMAEGGIARFDNGGGVTVYGPDNQSVIMSLGEEGANDSNIQMGKSPEALSGGTTLPDIIRGYEEGPVRRSHELERAIQLKRGALDALGSNPESTAVGRGIDWLTMSGEAVAAERLEEEAAGIKWREERNRIGDIPAEHWFRESGASEATIQHYSPEGEGLPLGYRSFFKSYWSPEEEKTDVATDVGTMGLGEEAAKAAQPAEEIISSNLNGSGGGSGEDIEAGTDALVTEDSSASDSRGDPRGSATAQTDEFGPRGGSKEDMARLRADSATDSREQAKKSAKTGSVFLTEWLANNPDKSSAEVPADAVNNSVDSVFTDALDALSGKKFDINAFKSEIEALMPKAEKDPEMEGLLIAMMGASIMAGKDANAWVNVGAGIEKSLPAIINFKNKQKEDQRARDMTIAKLAIETKLSREQDTRTAIREIKAEQRGLSVDQFRADESARRDLEKEQRQTANYMVVKTTTLPGTTFDPNASEDSVVNIPFDTKMNLTVSDAERLKGLGVPLFEVGNPTISYADIVASTTPTTFGSELDPEDWNRMVSSKDVTLFDFGTDGGIKLDYYMALPFGMKNGITDSFMAENEWASLYLAYDRYRTKFESVGNKLVTLNELAASGNLTGVEGLKGRIGDTMRGLGSVPFAGAIADSLLGEEALSAGSKFDVHARLVLAEIAPWILGESGKTISDSDRVRVAQALGYEATLENGVMMIKGFDEQLLKNPAQIQMALNEVSKTINKYIDMGDSQMAGAMVRFGRLSQDQSKTLLDSLGRPTDIEEKVGKRQESTPSYGVQWDLDLTAGGN